jgi:hypothetical protein
MMSQQKSPLKVMYPWEKTPYGHSFFVPSLNPEATRREGLQEGIRLRVFGKAAPCIWNGQLGVMFTRLKQLR